jgi:hypothetical protein
MANCHPMWKRGGQKSDGVLRRVLAPGVDDTLVKGPARRFRWRNLSESGAFT